MIAVRGERVALVRGRYGSETSTFDAVRLHVIDADAVGRICRAFNFGDDGLAEALQVLDRVAAQRGNLALVWAERWFGNTEWDEYRAACNPGFVGEDRRPLMRERYDLDRHSAGLRSAYGELASTLLGWRPVAVAGERAALVEGIWGSSTSRFSLLVALALDDDGRKIGELYFEPEAENEAIEALKTLAERANGRSDQV
jgi:hypothetical protein